MQLTIGDNTKFRWCKNKVIYFILFSYKPKNFRYLIELYSCRMILIRMKYTFKNFKVKKIFKVKINT